MWNTLLVIVAAFVVCGVFSVLLGAAIETPDDDEEVDINFDRTNARWGVETGDR